jgi:hypothetical protein
LRCPFIQSKENGGKDLLKYIVGEFGAVRFGKISFRFVSFDFVSFYFVSFDFVSFRFDRFRFVSFDFALYALCAGKKKKKYHCTENQNLNVNTERHRQTSL